MPSLRELQRQFVGVLFEELPDTELGIRTGDMAGQLRGARRAERSAQLAIYRNNLHAGFNKALSLEFPVIERLVGRDFFQQLARQYLHAHPSRAGDLHLAGVHFPRFLGQRFAKTEHGYLADVAQLEWVYQQAAVAADALPFDPRALAELEPRLYATLQFRIHPSCFLVRSDYPILRIWQVNQSEGEPDMVDLHEGPQHVLTRRLGEGVELRSVTAAEYTLLDCFLHGSTLANAFALVEKLDPEFDLARALRQLMALGLIVDSSGATTIKGVIS
jgi:hypothetical protein